MRFPSRLTTPRTVLRAWNADDGPILKAAIDHNKDHLKPWVPWATGAETPLAECEARVVSFATDFAMGKNWFYAVMTPDERRVIGGTGFHDRIGPGGLEIGYWIDREHVNRGLATEVAGALVGQAFSAAGVQFLEMHIDPRNVASTRVPERLGFRMVELRPEPARVGSEELISMMIWRRRREDR